MQFIAVLIFNAFITLAVAYGYHHREKTALPGEDYDGDTRKTLLGPMAVFHDRPKSYLKHVLRNFEKYVFLWFSLSLAVLLTTIAVFMALPRH